MGDIFCQRCREPWDADHLKFDMIYDGNLPEEVVKDFREYRGAQNKNQFRLTSAIRLALGREGWKFGDTVFHIRRCPGCRGHDAVPGVGERDAMVAAAVEVLGDDMDGLQAALEDLG